MIIVNRINQIISEIVNKTLRKNIKQPEFDEVTTSNSGCFVLYESFWKNFLTIEFFYSFLNYGKFFQMLHPCQTKQEE